MTCPRYRRNLAFRLLEASGKNIQPPPATTISTPEISTWNLIYPLLNCNISYIVMEYHHFTWYSHGISPFFSQSHAKSQGSWSPRGSHRSEPREPPSPNGHSPGPDGRSTSSSWRATKGGPNPAGHGIYMGYIYTLCIIYGILMKDTWNMWDIWHVWEGCMVYQWIWDIWDLGYVGYMAIYIYVWDIRLGMPLWHDYPYLSGISGILIFRIRCPRNPHRTWMTITRWHPISVQGTHP